MTPKERAAMQQALDALETDEQWGFVNKKVLERRLPAITALREALAEQACPNGCDTSNGRCVDCPDYVAEQAEQEPVAYMFKVKRTLPSSTPLDVFAAIEYHPLPHEDIISKEPLYAAPVRTKDLTEYELDELRFQNLNYLDYARAIIAADREKNRG